MPVDSSQPLERQSFQELVPVRFLLLVSATGGGHLASASAVQDAMSELFPSSQCTIYDPFQSAGSATSLFVGLYSPILRYARWLWGFLYHLFDRAISFWILIHVVRYVIQGNIKRAIITNSPHVIVSFHPLTNHVVGHVLKSLPIRHPFAVVITDWQDIHRAWICPAARTTITPSPEATAACIRSGLPLSRITELALPIHKAFFSSACDRLSARQAIGFDDTIFTVLVLGGGDGSGQLCKRTASILEACPGVQVITVCGNNQREKVKLEKLIPRYHDRLRVYGFVTNMPELMYMSDLIVTKAGPGAIAEALATQTPMIITWYAPGQEHGNVQYVTDHGLGLYVPGIRRLGRVTRNLAKSNSRQYQYIKNNVTANVPRYDARHTATALMALYRTQ